MTDASQAKKKTNKWLWPLLAALVLVGLLAWAFNRGADDGELSQEMAADPAAQQDGSGVEMGQPAPPSAPVSTMVPDNADGNASIITEADAARANAGTGSPNDGVAGATTGPAATGANAPTMGSDGQTPAQ